MTRMLVGRYQFVEHLGKGGFGVVEKYYDIVTEEFVAVKTVPALCVNKESKRLIREVDILSFLHNAHPHVIGYFNMFVTSPNNGNRGNNNSNSNTTNNSNSTAHGWDNDCFTQPIEDVPEDLNLCGTHYANMGMDEKLIRHHERLRERAARVVCTSDFNLHIVMPLMKGDLLNFINLAAPESLERAQQGLELEFMAQVSVVFAFQICFGLDFLHRCAVFHRDIKPDNVLVRVDTTNAYMCTALITDLGLARDAQESDTFYICTRYYRPPEMIMNSAKGCAAVDVWSLGCVFYELCTGQVLLKIRSALRNGMWDGAKASNQLEEVLNTLGTPTHEQIHSYMTDSNAKLYLLRSRPRASQLSTLLLQNWRLLVPSEERALWIDLITCCLGFFPQQRPSAQELCCHPLFRRYRILYGENVKQYPARPYIPTYADSALANSLQTDNKAIILELVQHALTQSMPDLSDDDVYEDSFDTSTLDQSTHQTDRSNNTSNSNINNTTTATHSNDSIRNANKDGHTDEDEYDGNTHRSIASTMTVMQDMDARDRDIADEEAVLSLVAHTLSARETGESGETDEKGTPTETITHYDPCIVASRHSRSAQSSSTAMRETTSTTKNTTASATAATMTSVVELMERVGRSSEALCDAHRLLLQPKVDHSHARYDGGGGECSQSEEQHMTTSLTVASASACASSHTSTLLRQPSRCDREDGDLCEGGPTYVPAPVKDMNMYRVDHVENNQSTTSHNDKRHGDGSGKIYCSNNNGSSKNNSENTNNNNSNGNKAFRPMYGISADADEWTGSHLSHTNDASHSEYPSAQSTVPALPQALYPLSSEVDRSTYDPYHPQLAAPAALAGSNAVGAISMQVPEGLYSSISAACQSYNSNPYNPYNVNVYADHSNPNISGSYNRSDNSNNTQPNNNTMSSTMSGGNASNSYPPPPTIIIQQDGNCAANHVHHSASYTTANMYTRNAYAPQLDAFDFGVAESGASRCAEAMSPVVTSSAVPTSAAAAVTPPVAMPALHDPEMRERYSALARTRAGVRTAIASILVEMEHYRRDPVRSRELRELLCYFNRIE